MKSFIQESDAAVLHYNTEYIRTVYCPVLNRCARITAISKHDNPVKMLTLQRATKLWR
jgi:hypothetical protein